MNMRAAAAGGIKVIDREDDEDIESLKQHYSRVVSCVDV
jgi:hypothetical protein